MNGAKVTLLILILTHVLPIVITQLLVLEYPFDDWENGKIMKWISTAANILLNCLALLLVILAYYRETDFSIIRVLNFECSYQAISRVATSNIICFVIAILIGVGEYMCLCAYYQNKPFFRFSSKYVLLYSFAAIPIILGYYYGNSGISNLVINEICRKTNVINTAEYFWDEDVIGKGESYVAITNNGVFSYELDQMYLSDNEDGLQAKPLGGG